MFNTVFRIVNDLAEAEDVMQEAFILAFEKLDTYKGEVSFGAWLKKIGVNRSIDAIKKKKAIFETVDDLQIPISDQSAEDEWKSTQAKVEQVKNGILQLKDQYRIILSLYFIEGYDHDEIADILGIGSSSSRSQLSRAKQKLVALIQNSKKTSK